MEEKKDFKPIIIYLVVNFILGVILGIVLAILKLDINQYAAQSTLLLSVIIVVILIILYFKRIKDDTKKLNKKNFIDILIYGIICTSRSRLHSGCGWPPVADPAARRPPGR